MPIPYNGPTSAQFRPFMGDTFADQQVLPVAAFNLPYIVPHITYVVQDNDTLADVARRLYGVNNRESRNMVRNAGFYPGSVINVPAHTPESKSN